MTSGKDSESRPHREKPPVVILAGVRWDFLWQRHQTLANLFASHGYPTVFVETTGLSNPRPSLYSVSRVLRRIGAARERGKSSRDPYVYSPIVLPPTWRVFREVNRTRLVPDIVRDITSLVGENPVVVAYPPTRTTLDAISLLRPRRTLYDCSDDYAFFGGVPSDIRETEAELLGVADIVSCTSRVLLKRVRTVRPDAFLCGPAVDTEPFAASGADIAPLRDRVRRVGYFGHLGRDRFRLEVFSGISAAGFDVRVFGEVSSGARRLLRDTRVEFAGHVPHSRLPDALSGLDAFVTPYREDVGVTRAIFPAKTYEMLATGKPVVSSRLPSLVADGDVSGCIYFASSVEGFVSTLDALPDTETKEAIRNRLRVAEKNTWESRFREIEQRLFPEDA